MTGTNDAPIVAASSGAFTELAGTGNAALDHAGGSITFADLDLSDRPTVSASFTGYTYKAANGTTGLSLTAQQQHDLGVALTLTPAGSNTNNGSVNWSYDVADNQFDFLADRETLTLTYSATVNDHHGGLVTKPVTVTVTGANDVPTLAAENAGKLTDTAANDIFGNLTGTLDGSDVDHGETASLSYAALDGSSATNTAVAGLYGSLTVNANGTYTYVPNAAAINALHDGSYTDTFTVQTTDVHGAIASAVLTVDMTGTNDAPSIVGEVDPAARTIVVAHPTSPLVLASGVNANSLGLNTETFDGVSAGLSSNNGANHGNFQSAALGATFSASGNAGVVNGSSSVTAAPFVGPFTRTPGHDKLFEHRRQRHRDHHLCDGEKRLRPLLGFAQFLQHDHVLRRSDACCLLYRRRYFSALSERQPGFIRLKRVCGILRPAFLQQGRARQYLKRIRDRQHFRRKHSVGYPCANHGYAQRP